MTNPAMDIIFPDGNEKELIDMAKRLGWEALCLVYPKPRDVSKLAAELDVDIRLHSGVLADAKDAKHFKGKVDYVFVRGPDVRGVIEQRVVDIIFDLESSDRQDFMHHRNSGLNQVICKLAVDRGVTIAVSFASILSLKGKKRAQFLGRTIQNMRFAKKYGIPVLVGSFAKDEWGMRHRRDLERFFN